MLQILSQQGLYHIKGHLQKHLYLCLFYMKQERDNIHILICPLHIIWEIISLQTRLYMICGWTAKLLLGFYKAHPLLPCRIYFTNISSEKNTYFAPFICQSQSSPPTPHAKGKSVSKGVPCLDDFGPNNSSIWAAHLFVCPQQPMYPAPSTLQSRGNSYQPQIKVCLQ